MSAELLREAGDRLDALADDAQCCVGDEPWSTEGLGWNDVQGMTYTVQTSSRQRVAEVSAEEPAAYIAAMSPAVGKALAACLRGFADEFLAYPLVEDEDANGVALLEVARAILGGES